MLSNAYICLHSTAKKLAARYNSLIAKKVNGYGDSSVKGVHCTKCSVKAMPYKGRKTPADMKNKVCKLNL